jgi:protein O-GlcNAc transferase
VGNLESDRDEAPTASSSDFAQVMALWRERQEARAETALASLLRQDPDHIDGLRFLAELKTQRGDTAQAVRTLRRLVQLRPLDAALQRQLGGALLQSRAYVDAIAAFRRAIALEPANGRGHNNLGLALLRAGDPAAALGALTQAVAVDPQNALAHFNRGLAQEACTHQPAARKSFERALELEPHLAQARLRLSTLLERTDPAAARRERWRAQESAAINLMTAGQHSKARTLLAQLLDAGATLPYLEGLKFHCELWDCDWSQYEARHAALDAKVREGLPVDLPFAHFVHSDSAEAQRRCAEIFVADRYPPRSVAATEGGGENERITVAYLSPDFHQHATAYLVAGLFEAHDRRRFRIIAASYGADDDSPMRARLIHAVEEFVDLKGRTDAEFVAALRARGVQIAVDLKGHTGGARTEVLAQRVAPVQVNFLGYPGTLGAPYMDYIVADRDIIPREDRRYYREHVVELPACYQPNDDRRPRPLQGPGREASGLPMQGLVFCCFNHIYKIAPTVFDLWMRLLVAVDGSVLWLLQGSEMARCNLRARAADQGVAPERVVFAPHLEQERHLARYRHVDLFLDTWPCNAHTTASDALWMGVPLVTLTGRSFPSRVATSLLRSLGLQQLCASSPEEYLRLALRIAQEPRERANLRAQLEAARVGSGLFDPQLYCRRLEGAYLEIWNRHRRGEPPASIVVREACPMPSQRTDVTSGRYAGQHPGGVLTGSRSRK